VTDEEQWRLSSEPTAAGEVGNDVVAGRRRNATGSPAELGVPVEEPVGEGVQGLGVTGRRLVPDVLPESIDHHRYATYHHLVTN